MSGTTTDAATAPLTAQEMGRKGGRSKSAAKRQAAQANGRKGGRPKGRKRWQSTKEAHT